jgi:hypothetical protein
MDRTRVPTQEEVNTAKTVWEAAKTSDAPKASLDRAEAQYRQLLGRFFREG